MPPNRTDCPACARGRPCTGCRRAFIQAMLTSAVPGVLPGVLTAVVDAAAGHPAAVRSLATALAADPDALTVGAPPVVGHLVQALRAAGVDVPEPACDRCGRTGKPLTRSSGRGVCGRCRRRELAEPCTRCGVVKPVAARDGQGRPCCARCADRPQRVCGRCGRTRPIARRARDGQPDICDSCFRMPEAVCSRCGQRRPCSFASGPNPVCTRCAPRATATCAHCGADRPPTARWPEGPVCDPCYTTALRRRGTCAGCAAHRRLVHPPGPNASICADCARRPSTDHTCTDCGLEDKLYERGRCAPCTLTRRAARLLAGPDGQVRPDLEPVYQAIITARTPRAALNWLRKGAGAALLAQIAAGTIELTHQALDRQPRPAAAGYLRAVLVANHVLPPRDEKLATAERLTAHTLARITRDGDRRLVQAYATWQVLRRLRATAAHAQRPRTYNNHARININTAVDLLNWLADRQLTLADLRQGDIDTYLADAPPSRYRVRDFLQWAATAGHTQPITVTTPGRNPGPSAGDERWTQINRLLHDRTVDLTDRVAGALLLLYGQQLSRITEITHDQITTRDGQVFLRLGRDDLHIPEPLAGLLTELARNGRRYVGVGSPATTRWLFPGMQPGRPITASRLGQRLRRLGIRAQPGRRGALTHLAAQLPAAVIADLLGIHPTTAANWVHDAGGDWNRYAAQLTRDASHQP